jgi:hypothetical protein
MFNVFLSVMYATIFNRRLVGCVDGCVQSLSGSLARHTLLASIATLVVTRRRWYLCDVTSTRFSEVLRVLVAFLFSLVILF